jgi:hypothetical protein
LLSAELAALRDEDVDLGLLGFDDTEIDRLLAGSDDETGGVDEAPEPPFNPISRPGDLWICGDHRVLCGDPLSWRMSNRCWLASSPMCASAIHRIT